MARANPVTRIPVDGGCAQPVAAPLSATDADDFANVFAALGDPVRLRLFAIIAHAGEACSCNLEAPVGRSQPTISHHTRILVEAGLIVGEKRGRWTWWRIAPDRLAAAREFLADLR